MSLPDSRVRRRHRCSSARVRRTPPTSSSARRGTMIHRMNKTAKPQTTMNVALLAYNPFWGRGARSLAWWSNAENRLPQGPRRDGATDPFFQKLGLRPLLSPG